MRFIITVVTILLSFNSLSSEFMKIVMNDSKKYSGELIERYEDRWFYESSGEETQKFILLFNASKPNQKFNLINIKNIRSLRSFRMKTSRYRDYLVKNNITFKNHLVNDSIVLTGNNGHHKFERMFGNFAWDISKSDELGRTYLNSGDELSDYYVFNEPVVSPINGVVVGLVNDQADNVPSPALTGDLSGLENNYLTIKLEKEFYLSIVHFKKGSIPFSVGDKVSVGDELGLVGNSGVSYVPHLHYTIYIYIRSLDRFISVPGIHKK